MPLRASLHTSARSHFATLALSHVCEQTIAASLEQMRQTTEAKDEASNAEGGTTAEPSTPAASGTTAATPDAPGPASAPTPAPAPAPTSMDLDDDDDDPELRMVCFPPVSGPGCAPGARSSRGVHACLQAMMMSLMDDAGAAPAPAPAPAAPATTDSTLAAAPAPAAAAAAPAPAAAAGGADAGAAAAAAGAAGEEMSEDFVMSMLSDLPGVDQNDPAIQVRCVSVVLVCQAGA